MSWYKGFKVKINKQNIKGITLIDALENVIKSPRRLSLSEAKLIDLINGYIANRVDMTEISNRSFLQSIPNEIIQLIICIVDLHQKPVRMPVSGVYRIKGVGNVITGRIEQGKITSGKRVKFYPTGCVGNVAMIEMHHKACAEASCGDNVGIHVDNLSKENMPRIGDVMVIDDMKFDPNPPTAAETFTGLVYVQDYPTKFTHAVQEKNKRTGEIIFKGGFIAFIHVRTAKAKCQLIKINWKMGKTTSNAKVD
eukprot:298842_1